MTQSKKVNKGFYAMGLFVLALVAFVVLGLTNSSIADAKGTDVGYITVDKDFDDLTKNNKVEVEAIFWYGCPYCYALERSIQKWDKVEMNHKEAELFHIPAPIAEPWMLHAAAYYVAEELDILDRSHLETFALVQKSHGQQLNSVGEIATYYQYKFGADHAKAVELFSSDKVRAKMQFDFNRLKHYGLSAVPAIVVGGQYVVTGKTAGGLENMVPVAKNIVAKLASGEKVEGSMLPPTSQVDEAAQK